MNKKKSLFMVGLFLIAAVVGSLFLRSAGQLSGKVEGKPRIVVSVPLLKHLVSRIGGSEVGVISIVKGASCNHDYEPTSQDLKQVAGSRLFIKVGLDFDHWVEDLVRTAGQKDLCVLDASQGVKAITEAAEAQEEHGEHHEAEEHHHEGNPHYWGSPDNVKIMAHNILDALIKVMPQRKMQFQKNYEAYIAELEQISQQLKAEVNQLADKRVISYSAAFPYFYHYFGFINLETVEDTCEQEITPKKLTDTAKLIKQQGVKVLVGEAVYPELPVNLARETNAKLILLWPGTNEDEDYPATLRENVKKLVAALR